MSPNYITKPPLPLGVTVQSAWAQVTRMLKGFWRILWQSIIPFTPSPEPPDNPPQPEGDIDDGQLEQCQKIFDDVEDAREHLEQKARATFTMVAFLAPLLASIFAFAFTRTAPNTTVRTLVICFAVASFIFLLLGFISIVRAVSVHSREKPFLGAVLDFETGKFRPYDKAFRIRGLIYCASVNQAMNDHVAQFVKGAHIFTATAVIMLVVAAIPAAMLLPDQSSPTKTEIVGQVNVSSAALLGLQQDFEHLAANLASILANNARDERLSGLEKNIDQLTSEIHELRTASILANNARDERLSGLEKNIDQLTSEIHELRKEVDRLKSSQNRTEPQPQRGQQ